MGNEMGNNASGLSGPEPPPQGVIQTDYVKPPSVVPEAGIVGSVPEETGSVLSDTEGVGCPVAVSAGEHNKNAEDHQEHAIQEDVNRVNHVATTPEERDCDGKEAGFEDHLEETEDVNVKQKDDTKAEEVNGSNFLVDPSRPALEKPDGTLSDMELASSGKDMEDYENVLESNMQEMIPEATDNHQFQKQSPVDKEYEGKRNSESDGKSMSNYEQNHAASTLKHEIFNESATIPTAEYVEFSNGQQGTENVEGFLDAYTSEENERLNNLDRNVSYGTSEKIREEEDESSNKQLKPQENGHTNELEAVAVCGASHSDDRLVAGSDCIFNGPSPEPVHEILDHTTCSKETNPIKENMQALASEAFVMEPHNESKKGSSPVECITGNGSITQLVNTFDSQLDAAGTILISELYLVDLRGSEEETKQQNETQETPEKSETSHALVESTRKSISGLDSLEQARAFAIETFLKSHQQENQTKTETFQANEVAENISSRNQSTEKHAIWESVGRLSSESNPENMNIHAELRRSPSFSMDIPVDAKPNESDQTTLLFQDKVEDCLAVPVEKQIVPFETSDSCKARNPDLALSGEENQAIISDCPREQDSHSSPKMASPNQVKPNSVKDKEKRKPRSSFLGTCICCATVISEVP